MLDPIFGSHYIQDAIDLGILAASRANPQNGDPDKPEAKRLYKAAVQSAERGIGELEANHDTRKKYENVISEARQKILVWRHNASII